MKVSMLTYEFFPMNLGGLGTAVRHMSDELTKITDMEVFLPIEMKVNGIKTVTVPVKGAREWIRKHYKMDKVKSYNELLPKYYKGHESDVLHAHDWVTADGGRRIKEKFGTPLVVTIHSSILGKKKYAHVFIKEKYELEKAIHSADRIIAVSKHIKQDLVEIYGIYPKKIRVVYNGVVAENFRQGPEKNFIFFIGRIDPMKGVKYLIDAYSEVVKSFPEYKLMVCGEGLPENVNDVKKQCSDLGLNKSITFEGKLTYEKLLELYSTCALVCLPSIYEPFGLTVLEGAASGKPVITTSRSGASEIVSNWKNAVVAKPEDSKDLAKSIMKLLGDKELRQKISKNAVKLAKEHTWERAANDILNVYKELV